MSVNALKSVFLFALFKFGFLIAHVKFRCLIHVKKTVKTLDQLTAALSGEGFDLCGFSTYCDLISKISVQSKEKYL